MSWYQAPLVPPPRGPSSLRIAVAAVAALSLIAGVGVAVVKTVSGPSGDESSVRNPEAAGEGFDEVVAGLRRFVERERGLPFKEPVRVRMLSPRRFRALVATEADEGFGDPGLWITLGLVDPEADLDEMYREVLTGGIGGFYDPGTGELVAPGNRVTPFVRQVLVHELTHALQDQHFGLERPEVEEADDESWLGLHGLAEGDASLVEEAYVESLSPLERRQARREEQALPVPEGEIEEALLEFFAFPYAVGPDLVESLRDEGGAGRLDAAFAAPPTTSEQLIHPDRFLAGEVAVPVRSPSAGGEIVEKGVLGELFLVMMLRPALGDDAALAAADGWGGDRYVVWWEQDRACVRLNLVMDNPQDTSEMAAALQTWTSAHGDASLLGSRTLTLTACGAPEGS